MPRVVRLWAFAVASCVTSVVAAAGDLLIGEDLAALGWQELEIAGEPPNQFVGHADGMVEVISTDSISALYKPVSIDLVETPCLAWSWRVDEAMPANDLRHRDTDDRPIAVYVSFPFDSEHASFWESMMRVLVEVTHGRDAPGRAIAYTWGGLGSRGDIQPSPYLRAAGAIVLLRPEETETEVWFDEMVNIRSDYERIFDAPAIAPMQVALLADSDNTNSRAHAFARELRFTDECSGPSPS